MLLSFRVLANTGIYIYIYIFRKALARPESEGVFRELPAGVSRGEESEEGGGRAPHSAEPNPIGLRVFSLGLPPGLSWGSPWPLPGLPREC